MRDLSSACLFAALSGFIDQCCGQAVGAVGRKQKKGSFVPRNEVTLYEFCESFRYENIYIHFDC